MRPLIALGAALCLGGCGANAGANSQAVNSFITTLSQTNCHVTGSFSTTVGAMNPGSGATLTTTIDCPNGGAPNTHAPVTPAATNAISP